MLEHATEKPAQQSSRPPLKRLGIIGCGHLAGFISTGLRQSGWQGEIVVTTYHRYAANRFAEDYEAQLIESSQTLIDQCELTLLSVRPNQYETALQGLVWSQGAILLSVLAGVSVAQLQEVAPKATIVRAMPISSAAINQSPTPVFPPNPLVRELFDLLGQTVEFSDEQPFTAATANAAAYGWLVALIAELEKANLDAGLSSEQARQMVTQTMASAATIASRTQGDLDQLLSSLATPGGITEEGLNSLRKRKSLDDWHDVFQQIVTRLNN